MMRNMRTTVTLDPDTAAAVQRLMRERRITFKQALNDAVRAGLTSSRRRSTRRTESVHMGRASIPIDRALRLAGELEDEELARRLALQRPR
jgi:hypothetical protein